MTDLSRRKLIVTGLAATAGVAGVGVAAHLAQKYGLVPPDHGGLYGSGETRRENDRPLTPKADRHWTGRDSRCCGSGRGRTLGAKVWIGSARSRRTLRLRRNSHLRLYATAHEAFVSTRILSESNLEASAAERSCAFQRRIQALLGWKIRGLAAHGRRHGRASNYIFRGPIEELSIAKSDYGSSLRRGLVLHRRMERRPALVHSESRRSRPAG